METSSNFLLQKSWVKLKGGMFNKKRFVALCSPKSVHEIGALYKFIFQNSAKSSLDENCIPSLGSIAYSAVQATPFLILLDSETNTEKPVFIQLDALVDIRDEEVLGVACSFELDLGTKQLKIQCLTSIDYQHWMAALDVASQKVQTFKETAPVRENSENSECLSNAIPLAVTLPRRQRVPSYVHEVKGSTVGKDESHTTGLESTTIGFNRVDLPPPKLVKSVPVLPAKDL